MTHKESLLFNACTISFAFKILGIIYKEVLKVLNTRKSDSL